ECLIQLTKLGYDATPFNQILKQNAKREMRLRLGKVTVADVLAAQPVTTNLLKFMRASIKMIGVSNLQSFIASMTQKLTLSRSEERFSRNAETDLVCRLLLEKKKKMKTNKNSTFLSHVFYPCNSIEIQPSHCVTLHTHCVD